jgi:hypothetical protein
MEFHKDPANRKEDEAKREIGPHYRLHHQPESNALNVA